MSRALEILDLGAASILGRPLHCGERAAFSKYLDMLQRWQRVHRLVGSSESEWIVDNLFLDSLVFLRLLSPVAASVVDVGTGAGFPGIPIKIVCPALAISLVESRERRVSFLSAVIRELDLREIRVLSGRAESAPASMLGSHDAAVARCAGDPQDVMPVAARLVRPGGMVICSGPPAPRTLDLGEWVEVPGHREGSVRRFVVLRVE
jgi:16S rRNA (guanine527-N7)-methyltransferase